MNCTEVRDLITSFVGKQLDETIEQSVAEHLAGCEECSRDVQVERLLQSSQISGSTSPLEDAEKFGGALEEYWADTRKLALAASEEKVTRIVHTIIGTAIQQGVSVVNVEPETDILRVIFRGQEGPLEPVSIPKYIEAPVIACLKAMVGLDITPSAQQEQGRVPIRMDDQNYDLQVLVIPAENGERLDLHIQQI